MWQACVLMVSAHSVISDVGVCLEDLSGLSCNRSWAEKRQTSFLSKLPQSDTSSSRLSSIKPSLVSFSAQHPSCFTKRLTFCSSPKAYCPIHLSSNLSLPLAIVVIVLSLTFSSCSGLCHHPGTQIYKLAAKAWLLSPPPAPPWVRRHSSEEIAAERLKGRKGEEAVIGWDMICQSKEDDTKNLNVSEQLARTCLPLPQSRGEAGLSLSVSDRERPGGGQIRSEWNCAPRKWVN